MKILLHRQLRAAGITIPARRREQGMAVIVVLALVSILLIYVACNIKTLANLGRELRLLEQRQTRRLELSVSRTNLVFQPSTPPPKTQ